MLLLNAIEVALAADEVLQLLVNLVKLDAQFPRQLDNFFGTAGIF
jgi:hypothetical protein